MKNVTATWDLPTIRTITGNPIDPFGIVRVDVTLAIAGLGSAALDPVFPGEPQTAFVPDVDIGDWEMGFTVIAVNPAESSAELIVPFTVLDDSPLETVGNVNITFS